MTFKGRNLPKDWKKIRARILARDGHRCTWTTEGKRCPEVATEVDHVLGRDNHDDTNLRSLCEWHHKRRTSAQGNAARKRVTQAYPKEKHPGVIE